MVNSAHVQTQLTTRSHACFDLSASSKIDVMMRMFKENYISLDGRVKDRLDIVSKDADVMLGRILDDTKAEQKRLLEHDRARQKDQEELYHKWLQMYVVELNKWRSQELSTLQDELRVYQKQIDGRSRDLINTLSNEANRFKVQILNEEQNRLTKKTQSLTDRIHRITDEQGLQCLGSESKTELNLRIQANVGLKTPGHGCVNDPVGDTTTQSP